MEWDGIEGTVQISPEFCTGVFHSLMDDTFLQQAQVIHGAVTWPNGLDLAPDTMYRAIASSPARHYEVGSRSI